MKALYKQGLVEQMGKYDHLSKVDNYKSLNAFIKALENAYGHKQKVCLIGFGSFLTRHMVARRGRNPQTGAAIRIKAHYVPSFHAGAVLKRAVNK